VLRAYSDRAEMPVLDLYPFASTSPIYLRVGNQPVRAAEDAAFFVKWIERWRLERGQARCGIGGRAG